ncbi:MAG: hypothetical protein QOF22_84 [Bradyrhizobium sp.]|jgi:hypothetical protein|nr:hypothetical protein [Bradyrhizobium sp.]
MRTRDDDINIRPGRIQHGNRRAKRPTSFVGEVMRAAKKAGHVGNSFSRSGVGASRSRFGRGRRAALSLAQRSTSRRVVIKSRVVRHQGARFRAAPLPKHMAYLKRDGVTRDGHEAGMFDAVSDSADTKAFAERCADDRHHFRFIVSPEDAMELEDLRGFTRELMADAARDLGTKLDWIAVDHWNTDNPHIHVLVRGKADDGKDLVISRAYISRGFSDRAAERATLTEDAYDSPTGKFLLIPQGARLIGHYDAQINFGQSRALLVWNRLIMPNGRSIVLERQPGADAEGYAGLEDEVDNHWGSLFKAAILSTPLSVGSEAGTSDSENNLAQAIRQGASQSFNQTGAQVVGRSLNVQPTITIRPGFPVRVIVTHDLVLERYRN